MKSRKRILLLSGNYYPEPTGIGKYNGEMMDWLSTQNFQCGVVTSYPHYPQWKIQSSYSGNSFWYKTEKKRFLFSPPIDIYRCPHYIPLKPTGARRILSDFTYFVSAFFQVLLLLFRKKYDYVLVVAPPLPVGLLGLLYSKLKKATLIYHIQDLQIDAAINLGLIKSRWLIRLIYSMERQILRKADFVSSISEGMIIEIKNKFDRDVILFPNWVDTKIFFPISEKAPIAAKFGFNTDDKIVLYSGAIGEKQGLINMLKSAKALDKSSRIKFVICGSGPYKDALIKSAKSMNISNLLFLPLQSTTSFNELLNLASIHLVLQKRSDNELFMPSKLTTILSVGGLVVVTATENTNLFRLITDNDMGFAIEPENDLILTRTIENAMISDNENIRKNALNYAINFLEKNNVLSDYFSKITHSHEAEITMKITNSEMPVRKPEKKKVTNIFKLIFAGSYFIILFYLVFFISRRRGGYSYDINLVPVRNTLRELNYLTEIGRFNYFSNIFGNVLLFFPLPIILKMYLKVYKFSTVLFISMLFSIAIETLQYIFRVGVADIDDVILNTVGACFGYFFISQSKRTLGSLIS
jgi:colanic acid biosynthesis glycosyl transferase WcaI